MNSGVGSVVFVLDGKTYRTESASPYALAGDSGGRYNKWTPAIGSHTLKAIPYSGASGSGSVGTPMEISFTVSDKAASSSTDSTTEPVPSMGVTKLTLVSASKQQDLRGLTSGATIDLSADGSALNVRADVNGSVGSVAFVLDGKIVRTENVAVYALAGDTNGVYTSWTPPVGSHTLKVIPYSGSNRSGTAGTAADITFKVQN